MALCGVCEKECSDVNKIKCSGSCENLFHINCVSGEQEEKIKRSTKDWKCSTCKSKSSTKGSVKSNVSTTDVLTKQFLIKVMDGLKQDVFLEMSAIKTEVTELSTAVQHVSDTLDSSNVLMEEIKKKFTELQKENHDLKEKNEVLSSEVVCLRERMRSLEQYTRVNNIEISGVPETRNEDIISLVTEVGATIEVEVKEMNIVAAHRVPSFRTDREPAVIVQFSTRKMKEQWIAKFRERKSLTARDINRNFSTQRVYINDHLSPENKQFLSKLKQKGRELGYKYVWCRDGKFFMRKAEGEPVKKINSYVDMDRLG